MLACSLLACRSEDAGTFQSARRLDSAVLLHGPRIPRPRRKQIEAKLASLLSFMTAMHARSGEVHTLCEMKFRSFTSLERLQAQTEKRERESAYIYIYKYREREKERGRKSDNMRKTAQNRSRMLKSEYVLQAKGPAHRKHALFQSQGAKCAMGFQKASNELHMALPEA